MLHTRSARRRIVELSATPLANPARFSTSSEDNDHELDVVSEGDAEPSDDETAV